MIENIFFALTLLMAAGPRAPGVEITFADGAHSTRYRLPLPLDNQSTRLHLSAGSEKVELLAGVIHDKSGFCWLDYDVRRVTAASGADVNVAGAVALPTGGGITIGEWDGSRVQIAVVP